MIDRSLFLFGWLFIVWLALQAAPVTRLVYHPQSVAIEGAQVVLHRSFPGDAIGLPRPVMSYVETIRPLTPGHNGGHPCTRPGGPFRYSSEAPVGRWSIAWAAPCLDDPLGYEWSARWTWHLGILRLGPVSLTHTVLVE